jgi:hypothetical protein
MKRKGPCRGMDYRSSFEFGGMEVDGITIPKV